MDVGHMAGRDKNLRCVVGAISGGDALWPCSWGGSSQGKPGLHLAHAGALLGSRMNLNRALLSSPHSLVAVPHPGLRLVNLIC